MIIKIKQIVTVVLFICYFIATIVGSNFWGNLLSPIITFVAFHITFSVFYKKASFNGKLSGVFLALSMLVWIIADVMWAVADMVFHMDPENIAIITFFYFLTNLFLILSLSIYGFREFFKWNRIQMLLDSIVISICIISLIWLIFLNEDFKVIIDNRSDWVTTLSVASDILICIWITTWFLSIRNGKIPLFLRLISFGALVYAITDLVYFYQYLNSSYEPNRILDAFYVSSFGIIAIAGIVRRKDIDTNAPPEIYNNVGRNSKGILLLIVPLLVIIFKGFQVEYLLLFVSIIMINFMLANYIQKNIYKEGLLQKEKELNNVLEHKIKARTEELVEKNKVLENLLNQDFITGLKNRRYLLSYLDRNLHNLKDNETLVLLFIDLNRFKMITTMFGHSIGEKILYQMALRLKPMSKRENSLLTSYGEDVFIYVIKGNYGYADGYQLAKEALHLGSDIYQVQDYQIRITANVGISIYPLDANSKETLIKHGDIAMSLAREIGFNAIKEYDEIVSKDIFRKNTLEIMLKKVDFIREFMLYYQPQLKTDTTETVGFEALLRWKTPEGEFIPPMDFIPIAEESGFIIPVGNWVIKMALDQLSKWNNRSDKKIMISINISLKQLNSLQFAQKLDSMIKENSLKPEWIDLEITESLQLQENTDITNMLLDIRNLGVTISIDDFGTGYSSLSYLKSLPADRIKIARELINQIHMDDFDYQLVKSIITLSKAKGIRVIAEGVETLEQWNCLKELQCDEVQGYYFGKPLPAEVIEASFGAEWNWSKPND